MELTRDGHVFVLRMDDGENRMQQAFADELHERLDEVSASEGPAALVTTGAGRYYSNGLDLDQLGSIGRDDFALFFRSLFAGFARLLTFPMVNVAAVNGHAFGAGALLTLAHDRRIMRSDRGWWCMPEAEHGWTLQPAMTSLIATRLDRHAAHDTIALARRWTGPEAVDAGVVDAVSSEDQVLADAVELAASHADKRSEALSFLKHDLHHDAVDLLTSDQGIQVPDELARPDRVIR